MSFHYVYDVLCYTKLVNLIRSPFFSFAFISIALGDCLKQTFVQFMSENVLSMFLFRTLMVSCIVFKSLSYFEFIYIFSVRECSKFIDLHAACQPSQPPLAKRLSFLCICLPPMLKIN